MGEVLETMIKALEERMDTGVLHDLSSTRLHMLIGEQLVKKSRELPDSTEVIEIIESAMKKYFGSTFEEEPEEEETIGEQASAKPAQKPPESVPGALKFKLNVQKNQDNFHAIVNKVPVIFSPVPLKNSLGSLVEETLENINPGLYQEVIEQAAFENSFKMVRDVLNTVSSGDEFQKIRLGMVIFKLLGFGDSKVKKVENGWEVSLDLKQNTDMYFSAGYVKGVFKAVLENKYENYSFKSNEDPVKIIAEEFKR